MRPETRPFSAQAVQGAVTTTLSTMKIAGLFGSNKVRGGASMFLSLQAYRVPRPCTHNHNYAIPTFPPRERRSGTRSPWAMRGLALFAMVFVFA